MGKHLKDKKIAIYLETNVGKPGGMPVGGYKPIHPGRLWAYVRQLSQQELSFSSGDYTQETTLFEINWRRDLITLQHYIEYRGIFYEIKRIDTFEGYKDAIKITASESLRQPDPDNIFPYE